MSTTLILIRMIEGFKIVDLPNILTNGGPGTATKSLTLEAYIDWRTLDLGGLASRHCLSSCYSWSTMSSGVAAYVEPDAPRNE